MHADIAVVTAFVHCSRGVSCHGLAAIRRIRDTIRFRSEKRSRYDVLGLTRNPCGNSGYSRARRSRDMLTMLLSVRMFAAEKNPVEFARIDGSRHSAATRGARRCNVETIRIRPELNASSTNTKCQWMEF